MASSVRPSDPAQFPVDARLVAPESRYEVEDGRVVYVAPADEPHGVRHALIAAVVKAHSALDYEVAVDMLTRTSEMDDIAPDVSVFPAEHEPDGARRLEELAFEVVSTERLAHAGTKAAKLRTRGVRRVFAIDVAHERVFEWSSELGTWSIVPESLQIEDRALATPLPIAALIRAALADDAMANALLAKGNRVLQDAVSKSRGEGKVEGKAEAILSVLSARGLFPTNAERQRILACESVSEVERWLKLAVSCKTVGEIFG